MEYKRLFCGDCEKHVRAERKPPNHILHLLLTVFTGGLWALAWLFVSPGPWNCTKCGSHDVCE